MGLGAYPAGSTLAGLDQAVTTDRSVARPPSALAIDGQTKTFSLDAEGRYREASHPVDAKVFQLLRIARGSIRSAADVGQGVKNLRYIDTVRIQAQVDDAVRLALQQPLNAGEIEPRVGAGDVGLVDLHAEATRCRHPTRRYVFGERGL